MQQCDPIWDIGAMGTEAKTDRPDGQCLILVDVRDDGRVKKNSVYPMDYAAVNSNWKLSMELSTFQ